MTVKETLRTKHQTGTQRYLVERVYNLTDSYGFANQG